MLYITELEHSLDALLAQENTEEKENALYYLGWTLVGPEVCYSPIENVCPGTHICHLKVAALPPTLLYQLDIKGRSSQVYPRPTHSQWVIRKMGGSTLIIRHRIHPTKSDKGTVLVDFLVPPR